MDFWLALIGFSLAILFLWQYHYYLKQHRGFSPCQLGRTIVMALSIVLLFCVDSTTKSWIFIVISVLLFLLVFLLNLSQAGLLHGCLMTFWQALASSIVLLFILMVTVEKNSRVPGKKENNSK